MANKPRRKDIRNNALSWRMSKYGFVARMQPMRISVQFALKRIIEPLADCGLLYTIHALRKLLKYFQHQTSCNGVLLTWSFTKISSPLSTASNWIRTGFQLNFALMSMWKILPALCNFWVKYLLVLSENTHMFVSEIICNQISSWQNEKQRGWEPFYRALIRYYRMLGCNLPYKENYII